MILLNLKMKEVFNEWESGNHNTKNKTTFNPLDGYIK